jgi:hypothetical protein
MNTRNIPVLTIALVLGAFAPLLAAASDDHPVVLTVRTLVDSTNISVNIKRGATREYVAQAMRFKTREELSPDVWAFFRSVNDEGCANLVITFANDKVVDMRLVNRPALNALVASLRIGSSTKDVASK